MVHNSTELDEDGQKAQKGQQRGEKVTDSFNLKGNQENRRSGTDRTIEEHTDTNTYK